MKTHFSGSYRRPSLETISSRYYPRHPNVRSASFVE
jgi:hypothetical protein